MVALLLLLLLFVLRGPVEIGWGMPVRPVRRIQGTTAMNKQHSNGILVWTLVLMCEVSFSHLPAQY